MSVLDVELPCVTETFLCATIYKQMSCQLVISLDLTKGYENWFLCFARQIFKGVNTADTDGYAKALLNIIATCCRCDQSITTVQ